MTDPSFGVGSFRVDTDDLRDTVREIGRCQRSLEELTGDLDRQVEILHQQWTGLAADAQVLAHQRWTQGMRDLRVALGELRSAGEVAHANYTAAADANLAMWRSATGA